MIVSIIGSGCVGRVMSLTLLNRFPQVQINLFDQNALSSKQSCGYAAAGMVAPFSEAAALGEKSLYQNGLLSLSLWPQILKQTGKQQEVFKQNGTIVLSHPNDQSDFHCFVRQLKDSVEMSADNNYLIDADELSELESSISARRFHQQTILFEQEACIQVPKFFELTNQFLSEHPRVRFYHKHIQNNDLDDNVENSDFIIDCRGMGDNDINIRGLRGEALVVYAPSVVLSHTIRLIHPRYPLYITPRGKGIYYIGATTVENADDSSVSVKSVMELLSALYVVHPGFSEARILKLISQVRPASLSGLSIIKWKNNVATINGLNRHGYLLSPAICHQFCEEIHQRNVNECYV